MLSPPSAPPDLQRAPTAIPTQHQVAKKPRLKRDKGDDYDDGDADDDDDEVFEDDNEGLDKYLSFPQQEEQSQEEVESFSSAPPSSSADDGESQRASGGFPECRLVHMSIALHNILTTEYFVQFSSGNPHVRLSI